MRYCPVNAVAGSIVLIGMMGAGKSSVGTCLQRRTALALFDTDDIVASKFGLAIPEIFSKHGENKFRDAETQALRELSETQRAIIVTGGGIVLRQENLQILERLGITIWLDANEETLFERASGSGNRPLLQVKSPRRAFARMLQARQPLYGNVADVRVDTSVLTAEEIAVAILSKLSRLGHNPQPGPLIPATA